jgi:hypothetical protein
VESLRKAIPGTNVCNFETQDPAGNRKGKTFEITVSVSESDVAILRASLSQPLCYTFVHKSSSKHPNSTTLKGSSSISPDNSTSMLPKPPSHAHHPFSTSCTQPTYSSQPLHSRRARLANRFVQNAFQASLRVLIDGQETSIERHVYLRAPSWYLTFLVLLQVHTDYSRFASAHLNTRRDCGGNNQSSNKFDDISNINRSIKLKHNLSPIIGDPAELTFTQNRHDLVRLLSNVHGFWHLPDTFEYKQHWRKDSIDSR